MYVIYIQSRENQCVLNSLINNVHRFKDVTIKSLPSGHHGNGGGGGWRLEDEL